VGRHELLYRPLHGGRIGPGKPQLPHRALQAVREASATRLDHVEDVEARRQRRVQFGADLPRVTRPVHADLEVLRLAGHPSRGGAGIGDLRVRAEPRAISHRYTRAPYRSFHGTGDVTVA